MRSHRRPQHDADAAVKDHPVDVSRFHPYFAAGVVILALFAGAAGFMLGRSEQSGGASDVAAYLEKNPEALDPAIGAYLRKHPEVLKEMLGGLLAKGTGDDASTEAAPDIAAEIQENEEALFRSPHQAVIGNPRGDVTLVEFFDYNCGFCKRALADTLALLKDDAKLRIVLKELPILGQNSTDVARIAVAIRMQDAGGEKYLAFHRQLLGGHEVADAARAMEIAGSLGLDMEKLGADMDGGEVDRTLAESRQLADALNISGTPSYVIGRTVLPGAVGIDTLRDRVRLARR